MPTPSLQNLFPNLRDSGFEETSPASVEYNCIAWAAGETHRIWWPSDDPTLAYWPVDVERAETIESFVAAFATLGYQPCVTTVVEHGFEKVALYVDATQTPTHTARQLPSGEWTSKIGRDIDIMHKTLPALEGRSYGAYHIVLRRPLPSR